MSKWLLEIARTVVTVEHDRDISWPLHYRQFVFGPVEHVAAADLSIRVRAVERVAGFGNRETPDFRCDAWCLRRTEAGYRFTLGSDPERPLAVATVDPAFRIAEVQVAGRASGAQGAAADLAFLPLLHVFLLHLLPLRYRGLLLHACGVVIDGDGCLFLGRSGAGKSTLARFFLAAEGCRVLSDDRVTVRVNGEGFDLWGTPWPGDIGTAVNRGAPLRGIFALRKSNTTEVKRLTPQQMLTHLLPVASVPWFDADLVVRALGLCEHLVAAAPIYELRFRPDACAVDAVRAVAQSGFHRGETIFGLEDAQGTC